MAQLPGGPDTGDIQEPRCAPGAGASPERVAAVRLRLAAGYYHAVTVRRKVADDLGRVLRGLERI